MWRRIRRLLYSAYEIITYSCIYDLHDLLPHLPEKESYLLNGTDREGYENTISERMHETHKEHDNGNNNTFDENINNKFLHEIINELNENPNFTHDDPHVRHVLLALRNFEQNGTIIFHRKMRNRDAQHLRQYLQSSFTHYYRAE